MAATGWLRLGFHAVSLAVVAYSVVWLRQLGMLAPWLVLMFTMWGLATLGAFLCVALVVDVRLLRASQRAKEQASKLWAFTLQLHELLFALACFFAVIVTTIFWGLFFYDRELIFPRAFAFPALLNHIQHTLPMVVLALEFLALHRRPRAFFRHHPPVSLLLELSVLVGGVIAYLHLTAALYAKSGRWPYPFMSGFTFSTFLGFATIAVVAALLVSHLLRSARLHLHYAPPRKPE